MGLHDRVTTELKVWRWGSEPLGYLSEKHSRERTAKGKLESSLTADVMQDGLGSLVVAQKAKQNYCTT